MEPTDTIFGVPVKELNTFVESMHSVPPAIDEVLKKYETQLDKVKEQNAIGLPAGNGACEAEAAAIEHQRNGEAAKRWKQADDVRRDTIAFEKTYFVAGYVLGRFGLANVAASGFPSKLTRTTVRVVAVVIVFRS